MLTIIRASCGVGKTYAVEQKIVDRARTGERSAFTFPTHRIARQTVMRLRAQGVPVLYRMSPHAIYEDYDEDGNPVGEPVCKFPEAADIVARSSMGVRRELCLGLGSQHSQCPHRDTCPAADGRDEDPHPLVYVAPHQLVMEAIDFIGGSYRGLLVLDEPPPIVETTRIGTEAIEAARYATKFLRDGDHIDVLLEALQIGIGLAVDGGALQVVRAGIEKMDFRDTASLAEKILRARFNNVTNFAEKIVEHAKEITREEGRPILSPYGLAQFRTERGKHIKQLFSRGAQVIAALIRAIVDERGTFGAANQSGIVDKELVIVEQALHLIGAINRIGTTVILDATIDLAVLEKFIVFWPVERLSVLDFAAEDSAPVERVLLKCKSATRKGWLQHDRVRPELKNFTGPLRRALEIVMEDPARTKLGIITFKPLAHVIEAAWKSDPTNTVMPPESQRVNEMLRGWAQRGGSVQVLHYGGVRGRNDLAEVDALVCLGEPWSGKIDQMATCAVLGLDFEETYKKQCAAELEQAVGRLRAPRRTREALLVVVGSVLPASWTEANTRVEELAAGRPRAGADGVRGDVLKAWREAHGMSRRELARLLGVDEKTLRRLEEDEVSRPTCGEMPLPSSLFSVGISPHSTGDLDPPGAAKCLSREVPPGAEKCLSREEAPTMCDSGNGRSIPRLVVTPAVLRGAVVLLQADGLLACAPLPAVMPLAAGALKTTA